MRKDHHVGPWREPASRAIDPRPGPVGQCTTPAAVNAWTNRHHSTAGVGVSDDRASAASDFPSAGWRNKKSNVHAMAPRWFSWPAPKNVMTSSRIDFSIQRATRPSLADKEFQGIPIGIPRSAAERISSPTATMAAFAFAKAPVRRHRLRRPETGRRRRLNSAGRPGMPRRSWPPVKTDPGRTTRAQ